MSLAIRCLPLLLLACASTHAATYQVGPGRTWTQLQPLFDAVDLQPGDLVVVDVDAVVFTDSVFHPSDWREILQIPDPDKIAVVFDHRSPAHDRADAAAHVKGKDAPGHRGR